MESTALFTANNVWMMICTALVFFMHLGFSFLEIGLTRQKNAVNILFKNFFRYLCWLSPILPRWLQPNVSRL